MELCGGPSSLRRRKVAPAGPRPAPRGCRGRGRTLRLRPSLPPTENSGAETRPPPSRSPGGGLGKIGLSRSTEGYLAQPFAQQFPPHHVARGVVEPDDERAGAARLAGAAIDLVAQPDEPPLDLRDAE